MLAVFSPSIKLRCPLQADAVSDHFRRADFPSSRVATPACGRLLKKKTAHRVALADPAARVARAVPAAHRAAAPARAHARVGRAVLVDLVVRAGPVAAHADHVAPAGLAAPAAPAAPAALAALAHVDHVDLVDLADLAVPAVHAHADRVDHADRAGHAAHAAPAHAPAPLSALQRSAKANAPSAAPQ